MKLYTEEQVLHMLRSFHNLEMNVQLCMLKLTPIEIPSNEEIDEEMDKLPYIPHLDDGMFNDGQLAGFELGAKWMRDKIKGGNK